MGMVIVCVNFVSGVSVIVMVVVRVFMIVFNNKF